MTALLVSLTVARVLFDPGLAFARDPCHEKNTPECVARQKENCRKAIDQGLATARDLPARGEDEIRRKRELVEKLESTVADHRRRGEDPCRTWSVVMGIAFNQ